MGGKKANMAACRARLDEAENQIVKPPECSPDFGFGLAGDNFQEDTHLWRKKNCFVENPLKIRNSIFFVRNIFDECLLGNCTQWKIHPHFTANVCVLLH